MKLTYEKLSMAIIKDALEGVQILLLLVFRASGKGAEQCSIAILSP